MPIVRLIDPSKSGTENFATYLGAHQKVKPSDWAAGGVVEDARRSAKIIAYTTGRPSFIPARWGLVTNIGTVRQIDIEKIENLNRCLIPVGGVSVMINDPEGAPVQNSLEARASGSRPGILAGVWQAATSDTPQSFAVVTVKQSRPEFAVPVPLPILLSPQQRNDFIVPPKLGGRFVFREGLAHWDKEWVEA